MGAGFAIAMRDLELRGAGNILGTQQSGHIATVGYELYCELLELAVRKLKQLPPKVSLDISIDLPCEAYIPRTYVPDMRLKIDLYRRFARVASNEEWEDLARSWSIGLARGRRSRPNATAGKASHLGPPLVRGRRFIWKTTLPCCAITTAGGSSSWRKRVDRAADCGR